MKTCVHLLFIIFCPLVANSPLFADDWGAGKYPFTPSIVENKNPELCSAYLASVRNEFFSTKVHMAVHQITGASWLEWTPVKNKAIKEPMELWRLDLDLDGSGTIRTLVLKKRVQFFGSGEVHYREAYLFESPATFDKWFDAPDADAPLAGMVQYFPGDVISSTKPSYEISFQGEHKWLVFKGRNYFLTSDEVPDGFSGLAQLLPTGDRQLVCVVRTSPPDDTFTKFRSFPGLKSYLKVLWTLGHASGGPCGTLHAEERHDDQAQAAIRRAAIRPWAVSNSGDGSVFRSKYYIYDERMLQYIEEWGYVDPWNHREYLTFLNHVQPAMKALERYYIESFDIPKSAAKEKARIVFEQFTAAHFLVPQGYEPGKAYSFSVSPQAAELRKGMIEGASRQELVSVMQDKHTRVDVIPLLANSVLNPRLLEELILSGEDPNAQVAWGKTALMVAAHLNRRDAVAILLKAGADPNLRTSTVHECGITIERGDRTALMYAAENASIDVMRLLIRAGGKTDAKDSQGHDLAYYLSLNPSLTGAQKQIPIEQLMATTRDDPSSLPTFNCKATMHWTEKLICRDPMLVRLDHEVTRAFAAWKAKSATLEETKAEQRTWLIERAERCRPFEEDELASTCLQRETQARVRYIYNRISE